MRDSRVRLAVLSSQLIFRQMREKYCNSVLGRERPL